jgi:probable HAF family extracellular repeat protein
MRPTLSEEPTKKEKIMKLAKFKCIAAMALLTALAIPVRSSAQEQVAKHHHYKLKDMGTFGGPESYINNTWSLGAPNQINRRGTTVGSSATSIPSPPHSNFSICGGLDGTVHFVFHAFQSQDGKVTDLGALPGYHNCSVATSINARGEIVGYSENGKIDALTGIRQIRAVLWKEGKIKDLGTFGGNHSLVGSINAQGQVTGAALNAIPDPFSFYDLLLGSSNGTQTRAFLWKNGHKQDLKTLGGPDAEAYFVNNHGQVIGISYVNSIPNSTTGLPTADPFFWTKDLGMNDLGTLGGVWGSAYFLNNKGQVIGYSSLAGDPGACLKSLPNPNCHPFLWDAAKNDGKLLDLTVQSGGVFVKANAINDSGAIAGLGNFSGTLDAALWKDGMVTDLGHVAGDCSSEAFAINSRDQVVGTSLACNGDFRSFLWENGSMFDLNTLIPPNSSLYLIETLAINDRGEIAGDGLPSGCNYDGTCGHAYVLIPQKTE